MYLYVKAAAMPIGSKRDSRNGGTDTHHQGTQQQRSDNSVRGGTAAVSSGARARGRPASYSKIPIPSFSSQLSPDPGEEESDTFHHQHHQQQHHQQQEQHQQQYGSSLNHANHAIAASIHLTHPCRNNTMETTRTTTHPQSQSSPTGATTQESSQSPPHTNHTNNTKTKTILEPYIVPNMTLEQRVRARAGARHDRDSTTATRKRSSREDGGDPCVDRVTLVKLADALWSHTRHKMLRQTQMKSTFCQRYANFTTTTTKTKTTPTARTTSPWKVVQQQPHQRQHQHQQTSLSGSGLLSSSRATTTRRYVMTIKDAVRLLSRASISSSSSSSMQVQRTAKKTKKEIIAALWELDRLVPEWMTLSDITIGNGSSSSSSHILPSNHSRGTNKKKRRLSPQATISIQPMIEYPLIRNKLKLGTRVEVAAPTAATTIAANPIGSGSKPPRQKLPVEMPIIASSTSKPSDGASPAHAAMCPGTSHVNAKSVRTSLVNMFQQEAGTEQTSPTNDSSTQKYDDAIMEEPKKEAT